jgi:hypothetical protein
MDRREEEDTTELCVVCSEEVDLGDASTHARVQGRAICRRCAIRLGGKYNAENESWSPQPKLPEGLKPKPD